MRATADLRLQLESISEDMYESGRTELVAALVFSSSDGRQFHRLVAALDDTLQVDRDLGLCYRIDDASLDSIDLRVYEPPFGLDSYRRLRHDR